MVSEEMSAMALGKRTVQFTSNIPEEHWIDRPEELRSHVAQYREEHSPCFILEGCGTTESAANHIEKHVREDGVQVVAVDYAQLLRSPGKSRYEQVTNTSIVLRQLATSLNIVLVVLCQLNREVEKRNKFIPVLSDIKDTGQLEQDADVIILACWPNRVDHTEPHNKYQFFIGKNRNRATNEGVVICRFNPARQQILDPNPVQTAQWKEVER